MRTLATALLSLCLLTTLAPAAAADGNDVAPTITAPPPAFVAHILEAMTNLGDAYVDHDVRDLLLRAPSVRDPSVVFLGDPPIVFAGPKVTVAPCASPGPHGGVGVYLNGNLLLCTYGLVGMDYCPSPGPNPGIMIWVGNFWVCIY